MEGDGLGGGRRRWGVWRGPGVCVLHGPIKVSINLPLNPQLPALGTPFCSPHSPLFLLFPSSHPSTLPIFLLFLAPCNKEKQTGHFRASDLSFLERWLSSSMACAWATVGPQFVDAALLPPGGQSGCSCRPRGCGPDLPLWSDERKRILLAAKLLESVRRGWD